MRSVRPRWRLASIAAAIALAALTDLAHSQDEDEEPDPSEMLRPVRDRPVIEGPAGGDAEAWDRWLAEQVEQAIRERGVLSAARIGIAIVDIATGRPIYTRDADNTYNVASNAKIITTAAALALLGPDFRYRTSIYAGEVADGGVVKGDLYLVGRGDPSFDTRALYDLAHDLVVSGVTRVEGGITIDDTYFDDHNLPPHFDEQPEEHAAFRAPIGALSLNFNAVSVVVRPSSRRGAPAIVTIDPPNDLVTLDSGVTTVRSGRTRLHVRSVESPEGIELQAVGQIRLDSPPWRIRRRVNDPVRYMGTALQRILRERGIRLGRAELRRGPAPEEAVRVARHTSPPLASLVRGLGKYSNNYVAETLLKTIGAEVACEPGQSASWPMSVQAVRSFLAEQIGLSPSAFRYDNGSGLFDSNAFTPRQLATVLRAGYRDFRYGPELVSSLALAGVDGTLRERLTDGPAERHVRAKTGTLATVSALSGYAAIDGTRPVAFSIVINDIPEARGTLRQARSLQDDIAERISLYARELD